MIRLIRHGESAANAGEPTRDHASIPLTAKGLEQAHKIAGSFTSVPELIVASPFLRAKATALATTAFYPAAAFETWLIHEFTYLAPARCVDTTQEQRRGWVEAYWQRELTRHFQTVKAQSHFSISWPGRCISLTTS